MLATFDEDTIVLIIPDDLSDSGCESPHTGDNGHCSVTVVAEQYSSCRGDTMNVCQAHVNWAYSDPFSLCIRSNLGWFHCHTITPKG